MRSLQATMRSTCSYLCVLSPASNDSGAQLRSRHSGIGLEAADAQVVACAYRVSAPPVLHWCLMCSSLAMYEPEVQHGAE
jgi:hypothetical protein